ncbi:MAG TPA: hypothetical protein VEO18_05905 [Thermoplasmata archaeon]|nr:hypothetical protein [Thermoplasmata archaeon]
MKTTTTVFGGRGLASKVWSKKVWKLPVLPLIGLLVLAGIGAAVLLGPQSATQHEAVSTATPAIVNLPAELAYAQALNFYPWQVTVVQNNYENARSGVVPIIDISGSVALPDCSGIVVQQSTDGTGTGGGAWVTLTGSFAAGHCTFEGSKATFGQTLAPGSLTNQWFFQSKYGSIQSGEVYAYTAQLDDNA